MPNIFKNDEQRKHWNSYNNDYSKKNYRTFCLKLNKTKDKDIIEFLEKGGKNATTLIKELFRNHLKLSSGEYETTKNLKSVETKEEPSLTKNQKLTNNLRAIRTKHGLTQTELAEILGVTKQGVCFNETGRVSKKMAEMVAAYFNVSVLEVMGLDNFEYIPKTKEEKQYLLDLINELEVAD